MSQITEPVVQLVKGKNFAYIPTAQIRKRNIATTLGDLKIKTLLEE
ncbi:MAG TPA: hypothetical protein VKA91_07545 [Nitrososphaeraceae archaeon]|nr:hypothetical protein [Nitrososphaeraceae archaeon]